MAKDSTLLSAQKLGAKIHIFDFGSVAERVLKCTTVPVVMILV